MCELRIYFQHTPIRVRRHLVRMLIDAIASTSAFHAKKNFSILLAAAVSSLPSIFDEAERVLIGDSEETLSPTRGLSFSDEGTAFRLAMLGVVVKSIGNRLLHRLDTILDFVFRCLEHRHKDVVKAAGKVFRYILVGLLSIRPKSVHVCGAAGHCVSEESHELNGHLPWRYHNYWNFNDFKKEPIEWIEPGDEHLEAAFRAVQRCIDYIKSPSIDKGTPLRCVILARNYLRASHHLLALANASTENGYITFEEATVSEGLVHCTKLVVPSQRSISPDMVRDELYYNVIPNY